MNWTGIWNRLWRMLDMPLPCYFSGRRFLAAVREVDMDLPQYGEAMEARRQANLSTSRRDYFRDIFMELNEASRVRVVVAILNEIHGRDEGLTAEIRALLAGGVAGSIGNVPPELWNADRLNRLPGGYRHRHCSNPVRPRCGLRVHLFRETSVSAMNRLSMRIPGEVSANVVGMATGTDG